MAAKRTHEFIPFCHQIPVESCKIRIECNDTLLVTIRARVETTFKTGVEMEALHAASIAALTIYDMCKAVSHRIVILDTKLVAKAGGKRTVFSRPLCGLILTGGKSERMGKDKALLEYRGKPHALYLYEILSQYCDETFLSARPGQWAGTALEALPVVVDEKPGLGPSGALLSAFHARPEANWIVLACDLPHFDEAALKTLLAQADEEKTVGTFFKNAEKGFPEALAGFYTPAAEKLFSQALEAGIGCPVKTLRGANVKLLDSSSVNLANANTQDDFGKARHEIR
jgi:cyclic pyranopterin phosphate synthase